MSKLLAFLMGAACLIWISAWSLWLTGEDAYKEPEIVAPEKIAIFVQDGSFQYTDKEPFHFNFSDAVVRVDDGGQSLFSEVSAHLQQNSKRQLLLTGAYLPGEKNNSLFKNLGIARAEAVRSYLVKAGTPAEQMTVESRELNNLVILSEEVYGAVTFSFSELADNDTVALNFEETASNKKAAIPPGATVLKYPVKKFNLYDIGGRVVQILDGLRNQVWEKPTRKLIVTGYSGVQEEAETEINLSEKRALAVRKYLVDTGLESRQVVVRFEPSVEIPSGSNVVAIQVIK